MFFSWATPLVDVIKNNYILTPLYQYARHSKLNIAQMGDLKNEDKVEYALQKLKASWKNQKAKGIENQKNGLFKAVILAYKSKHLLFLNTLVEYLVALSLNILTTMLNLFSPYLVKQIIDYINSSDPNLHVSDGLFYVALLVASQSIYYIVSEHLDFYQRMIGVKSTNAMIALIYQK